MPTTSDVLPLAAIVGWAPPTEPQAIANNLVGNAHPTSDGATDHPVGSAPPAESPHVLRLKLLGANTNPKVTGLDELPGKSNYFLGNDPSQWRTNVPTYRRVAFDQVYPGIDVVYYGNQRRLEYDFVVAPGADPGRIQLAVEGADEVAIDEAGNLVLSTPNGEIRQHKPVVYQEIDGERIAIDGRYVLLSPEAVGWAPPTEKTNAADILVGSAHPTLSASQFPGTVGWAPPTEKTNAADTLVGGAHPSMRRPLSTPRFIGSIQFNGSWLSLIHISDPTRQ